MATLEEVLLRIAGESTSAQRAIEDIRRKVNDLPKHTELHIDAEVEKAKQEIDSMKRSLESIDKGRYEAEIRAEVASALAKVETFKKRLDALPRKTVIDVDVKRQGIEAQITRITNQIRALEELDPQVEIDAKIEQAETKLARVRAQVLALEKKPKTTQVKLDIAEAVARSKILKAQLVELQNLKPQIQIDDNIAVLQARVARLHQQLNSLDDGTDSMRASILNALSGVEKGVVGLGRGLKETEESTGRFRSAVLRTFMLIKGLSPFIAGTAIILSTALVPAIIAAVGAMAAGAAGAISFASALAGSLIPAAILGAQVMSRFGKVMEAFKAQQQAQKAAAIEAARSAEGLSQAEQQRITTVRQIADAERSLDRATRGVAEAREAAADNIAAANQRLIDAQRQVADSARAVGEATEDAYRAMEDAAEDATDAVRELAGAEISLDRARLGVKQAEQDLKDFADQAGAAGDAWSKAFKKFTDVEVDFDVAGLDKLLAATGVGDERDALELEDKILRVREAKQREKDATDGLSDAERTLSRNREQHNKFLKDGISAYGPLRAALDSAAGAQQALAEATKEANELNRQGIKNAPGVIAAIEGEADARRNLARIRKDAQNQGDSVSAVASAAAAAEAAFAELTEAEKEFVRQLEIARAFMDGAFRQTTDRVFGGLGRLLAGLPALIIPLTDEFEALGSAIERLGGNLGATLASPDVQMNLATLTGMLTEIVTVLGDGAFSDFLRTMLIIGSQAAPALIEMMKELGDTLRGVSTEAQEGGLNTFVTNGVDGFRALLSIVGALLHLFRSLVETVGPFGADLARDLAKAIKSMSVWLRSAEGQKDVGRFFADTLPFVRTLGKVLFRLTRIFLKFVQFIAPFVKGFLDIFNVLLWGVEKFLDLLNLIVSNPIGRFVRELIGSFLGFNVVVRILNGVVQLLKNIPFAFPAIRRFVRGTIQRFKDLGSGIGNALGGALGTISKWPGQALNAISRGFSAASGRVVVIGESIVGGITTGIRNAIDELLWYGRWIVFRIRDGIRNVAQRVWDGPVGDTLRKIARAFDAAADVVYRIGVDMLNGLIRGFTTLGSKAVQAIEDLANKIVKVITDVLKIKSPSRVFYEIGQNIVAGLVQGIADSSAAVEKVVKGLGREGIAAMGGVISGKSYLFMEKDFKTGKKRTDKDLLKSEAWAEVEGAPLGGLKVLPVLLKDAIGDALRGIAPGLASGGLVTGRTFAELGEGVHKEAVLPLSKSVMRSLAQAITVEMGSMSRLSPATAGAFGSAAPVYKIDKIVVETPSGDVPDGRAAAVLLGRELERRGG